MADNPIVGNPESTMGRKVKMGAKRQLTLPQEVVRRLGLRQGDYLEVRAGRNRIELVPMALIPRDQAWFWTPEWQEKEKEADRALARRDYTEHDTVEEVIDDLKS
jgi:AbrB family looped-hinge helix DNA binding protein